jgi:hypothetical protein
MGNRGNQDQETAGNLISDDRHKQEEFWYSCGQKKKLSPWLPAILFGKHSCRRSIVDKKTTMEIKAMNINGVR